MQAKRLSGNGRTSVHVLIFEYGDPIVSNIEKYVKEADIRAARFTAIGALQSAELAFFDWQTKEYRPIPVKEQTEVVILAGDIAWDGSEPVVHAHAILSKPDGTAVGGHFKEGLVRPTLELFMEESGALQRRHDAASGLALIDLDSAKTAH